MTVESAEKRKNRRGRSEAPLQWIAIDIDMPNHPKTHLFVHELNVDHQRGVGILLSCLCWMARFRRGGMLSRGDIFGLSRDCAGQTDPASLEKALRASGFIEGTFADQNGRVRWHDWDKRQAPLVSRRQKERERKALYREKKRLAEVSKWDADLSQGQMRDKHGTSQGRSPSPSLSFAGAALRAAGPSDPVLPISLSAGSARLLPVKQGRARAKRAPGERGKKIPCRLVSGKTTLELGEIATDNMKLDPARAADWLSLFYSLRRQQRGLAFEKHVDPRFEALHAHWIAEYGAEAVGALIPEFLIAKGGEDFVKRGWRLGTLLNPDVHEWRLQMLSTPKATVGL